MIAEERWLLRLVSALCFDSSRVSYEWLLREWQLISEVFVGWTLEEVKGLTPRERKNWIELGKEMGRVVRKKNG